MPVPESLLNKETLAQVFSCEFREILKNTVFTEHLRWLLLLIFLFSLIYVFTFLILYVCLKPPLKMDLIENKILTE